MNEEAQWLIDILYDKEANVSEKDDAAMDLAAFDFPEVTEALVKKGSDLSEDPAILNSCGESLGEIWARNKSFDKKAYDALASPAKEGVQLVFKDVRDR